MWFTKKTALLFELPNWVWLLLVILTVLQVYNSLHEIVKDVL